MKPKLSIQEISRALSTSDLKPETVHLHIAELAAAASSDPAEGRKYLTTALPSPLGDEELKMAQARFNLAQAASDSGVSVALNGGPFLGAMAAADESARARISRMAARLVTAAIEAGEERASLKSLSKKATDDKRFADRVQVKIDHDNNPPPHPTDVAIDALNEEWTALERMRCDVYQMTNEEMDLELARRLKRRSGFKGEATMKGLINRVKDIEEEIEALRRDGYEPKILTDEEREKNMQDFIRYNSIIKDSPELESWIASQKSAANAAKSRLLALLADSRPEIESILSCHDLECRTLRIISGTAE